MQHSLPNSQIDNNLENFNKLTADKVRELLSFNAENGTFTWLVTKQGGGALKNRTAGYLHKTGYVHIKIDGKAYAAHRLAWLITYNTWPLCELDHINGIKNDNRILNLRDSTKSENKLNVSKPINNKSGYKGVSFNKKMGKFKAKCQLKGICHELGFFNSAEEANLAYVDFAKKHHGEYIHSSLLG